MQAGDEVILLDNTGAAYRVELSSVERDVVQGRVLDKWNLETEPRTRITLYQGLIKGQKFDWVLQKGTELGVGDFVPVLSARCIVGSLDDVSEARVERWQRIVVEAAEQAGRAVVPRLAAPMLFARACESAPRYGLSLIPWEGEHALSLRQALGQALQPLDQPRAINLFIGPEGGFAEDEIVTAKGFGVIPVTLGPRILRAETAGLAAAAAILYQLGDFG